jgi:superfamily II DNA or RNA helicase
MRRFKPKPKPKPAARQAPAYVNYRGEPLDLARGGARPSGWPFEPEDEAADAPAPPPRAPAAGPTALAEADLQRVLDALALAGWRRGRTPLVALLRALGWRRSGGPLFTGDDVGRALRVLAERGQVQSVHGEGWVLPLEARRARLPALLRQRPDPPWWHAVASAQGPLPAYGGQVPSVHQSRTPEEAAALTLLMLAAGMPPADYERQLLRSHGGWMGSAQTVCTALLELLALGCSDLAHPELWWGLLDGLERAGALAGAPALVAWASENLGQAPAGRCAALRLRVAERRLHAGDLPGMRTALGSEAALAPYAPVLEAAALARLGQWADAAAAFAPALKALAAALGRRSDLLPRSLAQWYLMALLAQPDAKAWTLARKFAVSQSGARQPSAVGGWGLWAHAAAVRLGDTPLDELALAPLRSGPWSSPAASDRADPLLLAAWLARRPPGWHAEEAASVAAALRAEGLHWKADLLVRACERLGLPPPPRPADAPPPWQSDFFGSPQAAWRDALAAITALGDLRGAGAAAAAPPATLRWLLRLDAWGRPLQLQALELSASGRGRPKPLSEGQLKRRTRLDPHDAAVARCLRSSRWNEREITLDLAAAVPALVGHPGLVLADAPDTPVELVEGLPVLQVQRQRGGDGAEHFVFRLDDELLCDTRPELDHHLPLDADRATEAERRDALRVLRESPTRARLLRITPAQRRVAELVSQRWAVPVDAQAELDAALRVLAGHFVLHSDAEGGEPVPSHARLVAQLQPRGGDMQLQLAVRPFGDHGPLLVPGRGRARLLTVHGGLSLATERDLAAESAHLAAVLEALPFLGEPPPDTTWLLEDPEHALAAVQVLGGMAAAAPAADAAPVRALEWPRGQPLRVLAPAPGALATTLRSGRDWFALQGSLALDESRVLSLQQLLALLREAQGRRFVALGRGAYLALGEQLRQRLADLEALAEAEGEGLRLGATAAAWLAEAAEDLGLRGDARWRERAQRLEQAAALEFAPPPGLQAELRPYQAEGCAWMARLAHAGFGACLADDMGLGKTVQTLALLLQRAALGPALVVAPTSVCRNWADEAARFAPALRVAVYGLDAAPGTAPGAAPGAAAPRSEFVATAAAGDVLVVSYALLLRDAEVFAARPWATLVLDEAQALKNAATQRVKAVAALEAGFRLALSGTPVENRLSDLWSLMQLLNPGLLGSAQRFAERFANPIERQRDERARARLRRLVSPFLLRRTKAQVLSELPPRTEIVQRIEPGAEERAFLEAARRSALERVAALAPGDPKSAFNVLAELTRLRRAACDPRLAAPELGLVGAKVQAFERLAQELVDGRHQALVFSQFTDFLDLLGQRLQAAGLRHLRLDGSTPAAQRAERVAAFQRGEAELFLISLKAGGFGLNLTAADYVVIADPWWNPAAEDQAMGRAHRIGQLRPVTVYRLVTAGSVEERIVALHQDKRELAEGLLSGQDSAAPLQAEELMALLRDPG